MPIIYNIYSIMYYIYLTRSFIYYIMFNPKDNDIKSIIERLIPLYPDEVQKATTILIEEYEMPIPLAAMIMTIVRMRAEIVLCGTWPELDARTLLFGVN